MAYFRKNQPLVVISAYFIVLLSVAVTTTYILTRRYSDYEIRNYILAHPEIVVSAVTAYRGALEDERETARDQAVIRYFDGLTNDPLSPMAGNESGAKVVVEFFDYQCQYCKAVAPTIDEFVRSDAEAKIIYKDFPILGDGSLLAARASLAAKQMGRFDDLHRAMLSAKGQLDETRIKQLAEELQIPWQKLSATMQEPEIDRELESNKKLAETLGIKGTPAFIVGKKYVDFTIQSKDQIQDLLAAQRVTENTRSRL
jgi:protein-disulfide isomerase